ncbi:MAG: AraC family transcriptional regulator [Pseudomonadaceae bacterium]
MTIEYVVRSGAITGFMAEAGDAAQTLLREAGLPPALLEQADSRVEISRLHQLLANAAAQLERPDFGLCVASHQGIEMLGLLGQVLSSSETLQDAMTTAQRYMSLHSTADHWYAQRYSGVVQIIRIEHSAADAQAQQFREMAVGAFHQFAQLISGQPQRPLRVTFAHSRISPLKRYLQYFGCDVLFDQEHDSLTYPDSFFTQPLPRQHAAEAEAQRYLAAARERVEDNLELQLRTLISDCMGLHEPSIDNIAALLNLHPRSLQRKLKAESLVFRDLVQDVRITFACWHLQASRFDITSLSDMLGYSDLSSFSRAFKRRMGVSPAAWRKRIDR